MKTRPPPKYEKAARKGDLHVKKRYWGIDVLFITAVAIVMYPFLKNLWTGRQMNAQISGYEETIRTMTGDEIAQAFERARSFEQDASSALFENMTWDEAYESCLNLSGDGMMGYIEIPEIQVYLPIYHDSTADVLKRGVGHLKTSSLPIGTEGTHCVLTGHRGLPGSRLFTYLDELEEGDLFYLHILNETYAYQIINIAVVLPDETQSLAVVEGKDLCTLVTCTPYGINTHRLLVTGERTDDVQTSDAADSLNFRDFILPCIAVFEIILYVYVRFVRTSVIRPSRSV